MFNRRRLIPVVLFLAVLLCTLVGCSTATNSNLEKPTTQNVQETTSQDNNSQAALAATSQSTSNRSATNQLKVHFLDVGQADSILVQLPNGQNMLVDAGNNDDGNAVVNYLKQAGVKQIDYLVGTHPHEDHIGGLDTVIKNLV